MKEECQQVDRKALSHAMRKKLYSLCVLNIKLIKYT